MKFSIVVFHIFLCSIMGAQNKTDHIKNSEDNVMYEAKLDGDYLHLTLETEDRQTMQSMLHRGFKVYFDVKGKKKKKVSVQYPLRSERPQKGGRGNREKTGEQVRPDPSKILETLGKEANYTYFDLSQNFNLEMNGLDISIDYSFADGVEGPVLQYALKIPKTRIADKNTDLSKLTIGVVSTEIQQDKQQSGQDMGGRQGSGGGQRGGNGGPPGGGGRGGNSTGGPPQQGNNQQDDGINFWFKLYPKKK